MENDLLQEWSEQQVNEFFSDNSEESVVKEIVSEFEGAESKEEDKSKEEQKKFVDDFFKEETEVVDNEGKDLSPSSSGVISALQFLKEKGYLSLEDGKEIDEETAPELLEESFEAAIENRVDELVKEFPDELKGLVKYVSKGGNMYDYLDSLEGATSGITADLDMKKEENQIAVITEKLQRDDYDDETIEAQIEALKKSGTLEKVANKHFEKILQEEKQHQQQLIENQKKAIEEAKNRWKEYSREISNVVKEEVIGDLKFSKSDLKEIPAYMTERNIKTPKGNITPYYKAITDVMNNHKASVQLAKLLKERNADGTFNFSSLAKSIETTVTKKLKEDIQRSKNMVPKSSVGYRTMNSKPLADRF